MISSHSHGCLLSQTDRCTLHSLWGLQEPLTPTSWYVCFSPIPACSLRVTPSLLLPLQQNSASKLFLLLAFGFSLSITWQGIGAGQGPRDSLQRRAPGMDISPRSVFEGLSWVSLVLFHDPFSLFPSRLVPAFLFTLTFCEQYNPSPSVTPSSACCPAT